QNACSAIRPGASSQDIAGWIVSTARPMSLISRSSNDPVAMAAATRSRLADHHDQKSGSSAFDPPRLRNRIDRILLRRGEDSRVVVPYGHVPKHQDPASRR